MPAELIPIDTKEVFILVKKLCNDPQGLILTDSDLDFFKRVAGGIRVHASTERLAFAMCSLIAASRGATDQAEYWKYLAGI